MLTKIAITFLICFSSLNSNASSSLLRPEQWWAVGNGSPLPAKITLVRHYDIDNPPGHPAERKVSAWFAPDSACLAWAYYEKYEPRVYGSDKYEPMKVWTDTTQADFTGIKLYAPKVERSYVRGWDIVHYTSDKEPVDKYGNWTIAYTKEFSHEGDYIERIIEYQGQESPTTKSELNRLFNIRNGGTQISEAALSHSERIIQGMYAASVKFSRIFSIFLTIIGLICGLIYWRKFSRWNRNFHANTNKRYNNYGGFTWIISAVAMYCLAKGLPFAIGLGLNLHFLVMPVQIALGVYIFFFAFPGLAKMLLYARKVGRWSSTLLLTLNLLALFSVLDSALSFLGPVVSFIAALLITFFKGYAYYWDQTYKCPNCGCYDDVEKLGVFDGGVEKENSQGMHEENNFEDPYLVTRKKTWNRNDYYQRDLHLFHCPECGTQWTRKLRGKYLGSFEKIKKEEYRRRID